MPHSPSCKHPWMRTFIWASFVTAKPFPRDLGVFILMQQGFDQEFLYLPMTQRDVFTYERARLLFEADIFWATEAIGIEELDSWLSVYQYLPGNGPTRYCGDSLR